MSALTSIEWTDRTWNPVRGCTRVSEGCRNCYAERQAARNLKGMRSPTTGKAFAQMTAQLSLGSECHDFVNNAQDCSMERAFLDQTVDCVDAFNQPTTCRCGGGTTQNTQLALETTFPECP